jgi:hypothetical protein
MDSGQPLRGFRNDSEEFFSALLEHFQEKWNPVFRPKMRPTQESYSTFSFYEN